MSTILDRALELARTDQAMTLDASAELCRRDVNAPITAEEMARFVAATLMGFEAAPISHAVRPIAGPVVHEVTMRDSYQTRDA